MERFADILKRHAEKITFRKNGCWEWRGCTSGKMEYGNLWNPERRRMERAHRAFYEAMFGEIGDGLIACHSCDNPKCINPHHIFLGTQQENILDMWTKGRARQQKYNAERELG